MPQSVSYPFGQADYQTPTSGATVALTITNIFTIVAPTQSTGAVAYSIASVDAKLPKGAMIMLLHNSSDTGAASFGSGFVAKTITGVVGKTQTKLLVYDGTNFNGVGEQIN